MTDLPGLPLTLADWDTLPRMFRELCDGHPQYVEVVYALDLPIGVRDWLCRSCWLRRWRAMVNPTSFNDPSSEAGKESNSD